jgi:hypothetical protein
MHPHSHFTTLLLTFTALFSMVNPFSGAFIFFGATRDCVAPTLGFAGYQPLIRACVR